MLYDNGALLGAYADAIALGPDPLFEGAIRGTAEWLLRDMQHPDGGFFSSMDADSEGEEGKYYVWRRESVKRLLTPDEYLVVETLYGLDKPANFEGKWNFHRHDSWRSVIQRLSLEPADADDILASARAKLLDERNTRIAPARDDKVLTSWNGLAIKGLTKASIRLAEPAWLTAAQRAADFIRSQCVRNSKLAATWCAGTAKYDGYLDDHANMLDGLLALLSAEWRSADIDFAVQLADTLLDSFLDPDDGGFYFTSDDHEQLIHRPKPTIDDALPPGNGTACVVLAKLGHLLGDTRYLDASEQTLAWARSSIEQQPAGHCTFLAAVEANAYPPQQIIVRGPAHEIQRWVDIAHDGLHPWRDVYGIPYDDPGHVPQYLPKLVSTETRQRVTAYVCTGLSCSAPITELDEYKSAIDG